MATLLATGGPPPNKKERDKATAKNAIKAQAALIGPEGIAIADFITRAKEGLTPDQAKHINQATIRLLCIAPDNLFTLVGGTTLHRRTLDKRDTGDGA